MESWYLTLCPCSRRPWGRCGSSRRAPDPLTRRQIHGFQESLHQTSTSRSSKRQGSTSKPTKLHQAAYLCDDTPFELCVPESSLEEVSSIDPKSCIAPLRLFPPILQRPPSPGPRSALSSQQWQSGQDHRSTFQHPGLWRCMGRSTCWSPPSSRGCHSCAASSTPRLP